jgi:peptidyl-prolyl cis-trans isomerase SurA
MENTLKSQLSILSNVRQIAYRFFALSRNGRAILAGESIGSRPTARRSSLALLLAVAAVAVLVFLSPACRRQNTAAGDVWAEVDGHPIYRSQIEKIYQRLNGGKSDAEDKAEVLIDELNILNEVINKQILLAYAAHSGITVSESEIDTKMAQLKSPYSAEQFEQRLKAQGITEADLRDDVRTSLTLEKLFNRDVNSRVSVSEAEISAYYERNKASFDVPETRYHLAQIEVTPGSSNEVHNLKNDDAKTAEMAQRKIQALYAQLRAGQDFATVAQNYSEDPKTALNGGDMGFIQESALAANPALEKVIKSLKPGQISGIIAARDGYHIVKLLGIEKAGQEPLSDPEVQSRIRETLLNEKQQLLKAAYIESLRDKAKVRNLLAEQIVKQSL